jgi:hypothetical protein
MDPRAVRQFADRDRAPVEASKRTHWARQFRERGPEATLAVADALFAHARRVRPEWPTDREREQDLAHHIELKRSLERAARAVSRR